MLLGHPNRRMKQVLKKWLNKLEDAFKRLAKKAFGAFPVTVGSVVRAILGGHRWALIVFIVGRN